MKVLSWTTISGLEENTHIFLWEAKLENDRKRSPIRKVENLYQNKSWCVNQFCAAHPLEKGAPIENPNDWRKGPPRVPHSTERHPSFSFPYFAAHVQYPRPLSKFSIDPGSNNLYHDMKPLY
jgi:hypothetical protein